VVIGPRSSTRDLLVVVFVGSDTVVLLFSKIDELTSYSTVGIGTGVSFAEIIGMVSFAMLIPILVFVVEPGSTPSG